MLRTSLRTWVMCAGTLLGCASDKCGCNNWIYETDCAAMAGIDTSEIMNCGG